MRVLFAVLGAAALGWGGWLAIEFVIRSRGVVDALLWFAGGPLVHDLLVAPLVGLAGLALTRFAPPAWRAPVGVGAVLTGVLVLLALPLLWRPVGVPVNPGLHDRDYLLGLTLALAAVWSGVVVVALVGGRRRSR